MQSEVSLRAKPEWTREEAAPVLSLPPAEVPGVDRYVGVDDGGGEVSSRKENTGVCYQTHRAIRH